MFYDGVCGAVGTMLLANALPSAVYQVASDGGNDCSGPQCFGPTHAIIAGLCAAAIGASSVIACRSLPLYRQIAEAQQQAQKASAEEML